VPGPLGKAAPVPQISKVALGPLRRTAAARVARQSTGGAPTWKSAAFSVSTGPVLQSSSGT